MTAVVPDSTMRATGHGVGGARYEVLPFAKSEQEAAQIQDTLRLTVTTSPKHGIDRSLEVGIRLRSLGQVVTLHVAARMVRSKSHLNEIVARACDAGIDDFFVIGGDARTPLGPYASAGELLDVLAPHPLRPRLIGIGKVARLEYAAGWRQSR